MHRVVSSNKDSLSSRSNLTCRRLYLVNFYRDVTSRFLGHFFQVVLFSVLVLVHVPRLASTAPSPWAQPDDPKIEATEGNESMLLIPTRKAPELTLASVGYWAGAFADGEVSGAVFGELSRQFFQRENLAWVFGLQLLQNGFVGLQGGRMWILLPYSNYEPYVKLSLGSLWKPGEGLATVLNIYRYQMRAHAGFADLMHLKRHFQAEIFLAWGLSGLSYGPAFSYSF